MREGVSRIFFEDEVMLEAQQRGIDANPGYDFYNLNIDAGSMWTRRIVAAMVAGETGVDDASAPNGDDPRNRELAGAPRREELAAGAMGHGR